MVSRMAKFGERIPNSVVVHQKVFADLRITSRTFAPVKTSGERQPDWSAPQRRFSA
jgi:hypothetical protein